MSITSELEAAERRLAAMINSRAAADEAQARADAVADRAERRDQLRRNADRCANHQSRYDEIFTKFGRRAPQPIADAAPPDYRRRLYAIAQSLLPSDHELVRVDPVELGPDAIGPFEGQLFEALSNEAEEPSFENLPDSVADSRARREVTDPDTGRRVIEFRAKRSFIADLNDAPRFVQRFIGKDHRVLWGEPFSRAG
jgi:hypothetical protein